MDDVNIRRGLTPEKCDSVKSLCLNNSLPRPSLQNDSCSTISHFNNDTFEKYRKSYYSLAVQRDY